ncbi:MAG: hypothetical protein PHN55_13995, partial [Dysgonamonadaceae bacterium]|nr:hypothetical protein [Dysgonamonadaceae bacterium]
NDGKVKRKFDISFKFQRVATIYFKFIVIYSGNLGHKYKALRHRKMYEALDNLIATTEIYTHVDDNQLYAVNANPLAMMFS